MKPKIISVLPHGHGHWEVKVQQDYKLSANVWTYITNDSMLIDEYKYGPGRYGRELSAGEHPKKATKELIRRAKMDGSKKTIKI